MKIYDLIFLTRQQNSKQEGGHGNCFQGLMSDACFSLDNDLEVTLNYTWPYCIPTSSFHLKIRLGLKFQAISAKYHHLISSLNIIT